MDPMIFGFKFDENWSSALMKNHFEPSFTRGNYSVPFSFGRIKLVFVVPKKSALSFRKVNVFQLFICLSCLSGEPENYSWSVVRQCRGKLSALTTIIIDLGFFFTFLSEVSRWIPLVNSSREKMSQLH